MYFIRSELTIRHPTPGVRYTAGQWQDWLATTKTVDVKSKTWRPLYPGWRFDRLAEDDSGSKSL